MDNLNEFKELIAEKVITKQYKHKHFPAWRKSLELQWNQTFFLWHILLISFNAILLYMYFKGQIGSSSLITISLSNLLLTLLTRNRWVNNALFYITGKTKFRHLHYMAIQFGDFHREAAISTIFWFVFYTSAHPLIPPYSDDVLEIIIITLLMIILITATKSMRNRYHKLFEFVHRYVSYTILILVMVYFTLTIIANAQTVQEVFYEPALYLLALIILFTIEPWIFLKKERVKIARVSPHVTILTRRGKPKVGTFTRFTIGDGQFHSFADSIYHIGNNSRYAYYVAKAGDATASLNRKCSHGKRTSLDLTFRRGHTRGFMSLVPSYDKVVLIATGGGIAPALPNMLLARDDVDMKVIWVTYDPVTELGQEFVDQLIAEMERKNIEFHILLTNKIKVEYEELIHLLVEFVEHVEPEATFVVSNPPYTRDLLWTLKRKRLKAYGATFDS